VCGCVSAVSTTRDNKKGGRGGERRGLQNGRGERLLCEQEKGEEEGRKGLSVRDGKYGETSRYLAGSMNTALPRGTDVGWW
jgi:hypothetical protein